MSDDAFAIYKLLKDDERYGVEAYTFVRDALAYAQDVLRMGQESDVEPTLDLETEKSTPERHLTGQDLCEAIRLYSIDQFGYMARIVLKNWGILSTSDIGNIVYNLISIGWMKKSSEDRRDHFDDVFDFEEAFEKTFQFTQSI
ncbi:MAG: Minf_1886 family protein [Planctomycetota bacterium]|nr:Minf_1886 family protein [Planctomycetota bacterium]